MWLFRHFAFLPYLFGGPSMGRRHCPPQLRLLNIVTMCCYGEEWGLCVVTAVPPNWMCIAVTDPYAVKWNMTSTRRGRCFSSEMKQAETSINKLEHVGTVWNTQKTFRNPFTENGTKNFYLYVWAGWDNHRRYSAVTWNLMLTNNQVDIR